MKRLGIFTFALLMTTSVMAFDPLSVDQMQAPAGCIDQPDLVQEMDLPTLVQIAICRNPTLNRDYMSVKSREAELGMAKGEYLPTVDASGSIQKTVSKTEGHEKDDRSPYSGNVALNWLLYDFGRRGATTDQIRAYLSSDTFNYNAALHDTVLAVNQAYFDVLSNQEVLKAAQESVKSYKQSYDETVKRYQLGMVPLSDKLLAQTTYQKSELAVLEAENALSKSGAVLATLLNLPTDTKFTLIVPPKTDGQDITALETTDSVQNMMETALTLRPEIKSALSSQDAAKLGIDIARSGHYPTLSANASAGYNNAWSGSSNYQTDTRAGLGISVPLFNGFKTSYGVQKAQYQYNRTTASVQETEDAVKKEVFDAYQDYTTAVSSYHVNQKVLESARESERVALVSYKAGKESILNLLTAQSQLASARQGVAVSFYNVLTSKATLYRAIGRF